MLLGAHFSIRPSLLRALENARALNLVAVQIFAYRRHEFYFDSSLSEEKRRRLEEEMAAWRETVKQDGVEGIAVHSRAVALLAIRDKARRGQIIVKFRQELELARMLKARWYVFHLGPYEEDGSLDEGLALAGAALEEILESARPGAPAIALENVPGGARRMGADLRELAAINRRLERFGAQFGFCLDFAHLWGAGYDLTSREKAQKFFEEFSGRLGAKKLLLLHLNNSNLPLAGRKDEHAHLDQGHIPAEVYAEALNRWGAAAGFLETPKDFPDADRRNIAFLKKLTG
ncbi:MAG: TIM barrel protein [Elusimicrobiota bacterium]